MSAKTNYFKIGLFVIITAALVIAGVLALGVGSLFAKGVMFETYFDQSVQGLDVGSPVKYRGVPIGKVESIGLVQSHYMIDPASEAFKEYAGYVVVQFSITSSQFLPEFRSDTTQLIERMIESGLRLKLGNQGITGIMYVELDYVDAARFPVPEVPWKPKLGFIPSVRDKLTQLSDSMEKVFQRAEQIDVEALMKKVEGFLKSVDATLAETNVAGLSEDAKILLEEVRGTNARFSELLRGPDVDQIAEDAGAISASARSILDSVDREVEPLLTNLREVSDKLRETADQMNTLLAEGKVRQTLDNLAETSEKVRVASENLPATSEQVQRTIRRVDQLASAQQENLGQLVENLRVISENMKQITSDARRYPSYSLFGDAPPLIDPSRK